MKNIKKIGLFYLVLSILVITQLFTGTVIALGEVEYEQIGEDSSELMTEIEDEIEIEELAPEAASGCTYGLGDITFEESGEFNTNGDRGVCTWNAIHYGDGSSYGVYSYYNKHTGYKATCYVKTYSNGESTSVWK